MSLNKPKFLLGYSIVATLKFIPAILVLYSSLALGDHEYGKYVKILLYQGLYGLLISFITPQAYVMGVVNNEKIPLTNIFLFTTLSPIYFIIIEDLSTLNLIDKFLVWLASLFLMVYTLVKSYYEAKQEHSRLIIFEQLAVISSIAVMLYLVFIANSYQYVVAFGQGYFALFMIIIVCFNIDKSNLSLKKFSLVPRMSLFNYTWPLYVFNLFNYLSKNLLGFLIAGRLSEATLGKYGIIVRIANMISELSVGPTVRYLLPEFLEKAAVHFKQYIKLIFQVLISSFILALMIFILLDVIGPMLFDLPLDLSHTEWLAFGFYSMAIAVYSTKGLLLNALGKNKLEIVLAMVLLGSTYLFLEVYFVGADTISLVGLIVCVASAVSINTIAANKYFFYAKYFD